ncbi:uncharacterized protein HD556DRAFT_682696 [Suillus plorans]|uniref:Uncharacterized protein n=1 Tax=Suillus plorans TaxID=116603 RepID=A0A9P7AJ57_9AGAM|nr:uncharacterized protein HD556DRAFT_682696 [Suillus plorans]KAG1790618.1 hypothetical protein HD556DRAFT_682696 [Suillus plorans]
MSSDKCNVRLSLCSPSLSAGISTLVFILDVLKIVTLVLFYLVVIMAGLAFDVCRCQFDPSTAQSPALSIDSLRLQEAEKAVCTSKAASSSATCASSPSGLPPSSSSPAILESDLDNPRLVPEPRLHWSISCSDISPQLHNAPIGPGHYVHALFSDAWNENAVLLKQLLHVQDALNTANADIDGLVLENLTMSNQMDRFRRDLEIEEVRRNEAELTSRDATAKMSSQRSILSSLQSANIALRFEIANLKAERDELIAEKTPSDLQQEHDEEVQALQGTLVRTKRELERAKKELRKLKRAAAGIPELKIISPEGNVIPYTSSSTDSLSEDRNISMRERLTLAYTEIVGLRDQCTALHHHADENAELQEDVKQLLAQRSGLWDQVEAGNSACRKLEEENKKYFRQFVEIRAELTKVEKRTGQLFASLLCLALKLPLVKESQFQSSKKRRKSPKWQLILYPKFHRLIRAAVRHLMTTLTMSLLLPRSRVIRWHPRMTLTYPCPLRLIHLIHQSLPPHVLHFPHPLLPLLRCPLGFRVLTQHARILHSTSFRAHPSRMRFPCMPASTSLLVSAIVHSSPVVDSVFPSSVLPGLPLAPSLPLSTKRPPSGSWLWIWMMRHPGLVGSTKNVDASSLQCVSFAKVFFLFPKFSFLLPIFLVPSFLRFPSFCIWSQGLCFG